MSAAYDGGSGYSALGYDQNSQVTNERYSSNSPSYTVETTKTYDSRNRLDTATTALDGRGDVVDYGNGSMVAGNTARSWRPSHGFSPVSLGTLDISATWACNYL